MNGSKLGGRTSTDYANDAESMSDFLSMAASIMPPRTSLRQCMAFLIVAQHHFRNQSITMAQLLHLGGQDAEGKPLLGKSIEKTFGIFLEPRPAVGEHDNLGWVIKEHDPTDLRVRYLKLTKAGIQACHAMADAHHG